MYPGVAEYNSRMLGYLREGGGRTVWQRKKQDLPMHNKSSGLAWHLPGKWPRYSEAEKRKGKGELCSTICLRAFAGSPNSSKHGQQLLWVPPIKSVKKWERERKACTCTGQLVACKFFCLFPRRLSCFVNCHTPPPKHPGGPQWRSDTRCEGLWRLGQSWEASCASSEGGPQATEEQWGEEEKCSRPRSTTSHAPKLFMLSD